MLAGADPLAGRFDSDQPHVRVTAQSLSDITPTWQNIHNSLRKADLLHQSPYLTCVNRRFLRGFDHDGIAGQQCWRQFTHQEKEWIVPGKNPGNDTERHNEHEDILTWTVALQNLTFITPGPLGRELEVIRGCSHLCTR